MNSLKKTIFLQNLEGIHAFEGNRIILTWMPSFTLGALCNKFQVTTNVLPDHVLSACHCEFIRKVSDFRHHTWIFPFPTQKSRGRKQMHTSAKQFRAFLLMSVFLALKCVTLYLHNVPLHCDRTGIVAIYG